MRGVADSRQSADASADIIAIYDIHDLDNLAGEIQRELGVGVPYSMAFDWHAFTARCELRDLLATVTVAYQFLIKKARSGLRDTRSAERWLSESDRIFREENVCYRVDSRGGVHFSIDEEFERNRAATISSLTGPRYANVLDQFENAYTQLAETPPNGKNAIWAVFAAQEGLFRLMFPGAPRLSASEVDKYLSSTTQRLYSTDPTALRSAAKVITSFKEWVDAVHFYRHESGKEDVAQPPLTLAINLISLGASYLRWLAEIDATTQK